MDCGRYKSPEVGRDIPTSRYLWTVYFLDDTLIYLFMGRLSLCCSAGFSSCGRQAQQLGLAGYRAFGLWLWWHAALVAPWSVESSQSRDQIHVPCTGRRILNHWATSEVLDCLNTNQCSFVSDVRVIMPVIIQKLEI